MPKNYFILKFITTHWPVLTMLALTDLPYTSGESIRPSQAATGLIESI